MTRMARRVAAAACAMIVGGTPVGASAGELAPSKPSQVVVVNVNPASPPCPNGSAGMFQLDQKLNSDGTRSTFVIPPKSVLVVTRFQYSFSTLTANRFVAVSLTVAEPEQAMVPPLSSAFDGTITDADGRAIGSSEIPGGLIVKPPAVLCATLPISPGESGGVTVGGFLARDK